MSRRRPAQLTAVILLLAGLTGLVGCSADNPLNPSFPLTVRQARDALREMRADPVPLERPVVVMSGIHDPGLIVSGLTRRLKKVATDQPIIDVAFFGANTFDACRDRVMRAVEAEVPSDDPQFTIEVDVIAISMGGVVARHCARPRDDGERRLKIARLFTISSPHQGAKLAGLPTLDRRQIDMRAGSAFLRGLDNALAEADYELVPYVRLGDGIVGQDNAAPAGKWAWWVPTPAFSLAHIQASRDSRIIADIARRLRGEAPWTTAPAAAPPGREPQAEAASP